MNAYMNISVRVLSASAQAQIKALQAQVAGLQKQLAAANATSASGAFLGGAASRKSMAAFGSQLQWTGRQLQYNFTLPILLAAGAATKFALDNEKAMTRIQKVYGDSDDATQYFTRNTEALNRVLGDTKNEERLLQVRKEHPGITDQAAAAQVVFANETDALGRAMEKMSNIYGVTQSEVLETGSAWAAAGVSGVALAKATDLSLRAAVLGDLDLAKATESLIAIQGQYQLSTKELNLTLAELNAIENQTGISMAGLIDGFARSAGTAREFGVDVRHLGAMMAALVPATGSAASAGNSLKTIMSRLLNPTQAASQVMKAFGIDTSDASWKSSTAMDRLQAVADKMNGTLRKTGQATKDVADDGYALSDSQKAVVASTLGSNYQVNRFLVLMRELGPQYTNYEKGLNATADKAKVLATATYELNKVLDSSPQRLKIIWTMMQNGMADAIQPLIPYLLYLADVIGHAVTAFNGLDPALQKMILSGLLLLAVMGPILKMFGATVVMVTYLAKPFVLLSAVLGAVGGAFMSLFRSTTMVDDVASHATRTWVKFLNPFKWASDLISMVTGRLWAAVSGLTAWSTISQHATAMMSLLGKGVGYVLTQFFKFTSFKFAWDKLLEGLGALSSGIVNTFRTRIVPAFFVMMAFIQNGLRQKVSDIGLRISLAIGGWQTSIAKALGGVAATMLAPWDGVWTSIVNGAKGFYRPFAEVFFSIGMAMGDGLSRGEATLQIFKSRIQNIFMSLQMTVGRVFGALFASVNFGGWQQQVGRGLELIISVFKKWAVRLAIIAVGAWQSPVVAQRVWQIISLNATVAWAAATTAIMAGWGRASVAITAAAGAANATLQRAWQIIYTNIAVAGALARLAAERAYAAASTAITALWGRATMALQVAFWRSIVVVQTAGSAAMRGIWAGMMAAKMAVSAAFWSRIIALYIAGMMALKRIALAGVRFIAGPWGILIITVLQLMYHFREQLTTIWNNIINYFGDGSNAMTQGVIKAFNALPQGVSNALVAVANIVKRAALAIYGWFSYINPFAHHSPSLVENVTNGTAVVGDQFMGMADTVGRAAMESYDATTFFSESMVKAGDNAKSAFGSMADVIAGDIGRSTAQIKAFEAATKGLVDSSQGKQVKEDRKTVKKFAPGSLDEFDALQRTLKSLNGDLAYMEDRVDSQQAVVDKWTDKLDAANAALDRQQEKLDRLTDVQQKYQDLLDAASQRLEDFASAPIQGMQAMSDAIFNNEIAQKRLRLEMMKMEDVGGTLDDVKSKIEAINGAQELLRGTQSDLRNAGAGSEILSAYDDQISKLEEQKKALASSAAPIQAMTDQLAALQREADRMDLEQSLAFDPLTRQIDQAAHAMKEMPFDQIMAGVQGAKADMALYGAALDEATAKVAAQQAVVDAATAKRDAVQKQLDVESEKLTTLKDRYDDVNDAIQAVTESLNLATQAAGDLKAKKDEALKKKKEKKESLGSPALQNFKAAKGGNFADVGGAGIPIRKNFDDQSAGIDKFAQSLGDQASGALAGLNPFAPIMKYWDKFKSWFSGVWGQLTPIVQDAFSNIFKGVSFGGGDGGDLKKKADDVINGIRTSFYKVKDFFKDNIIDPIMALWRLFWPDIKDGALNAWDALQPVLDQFSHEFSKWADLFHPAIDALGGLWDVVKVIVAQIILRFSFIGKIISSVFANVIGPVITMIGGVLVNLFQIIRGAVQIVIGFFQLIHGIFTGNGDMIKDAVKLMGAGILNIFSGLMGGIWAIIKGAFGIIVGAVWGIVKGIWNWFAWLYDEIIGHSIIPDLINGIKFWFGKLVDLVQWVWNNVLKPIWNHFVNAFNLIIAAIGLWWAGIMATWEVLKTLGQWVWDNVLSPVLNFFTSLWSNYIQPFLAAWWEGIKAEWAMLLTLGQWVWDNVLVPVYNFFVGLWDDVKAGLEQWWSWIKQAWNGLKTAATWVKQNMLQPVLDAFGWVWTQVKAGLDQWWTWIKAAWDGIKSAGQWLRTNALQPVIDAFGWVWTQVKSGLDQWWGWIKTAWDNITKAGTWITDNVMVPVKNAFIDGWNAVSNWFTNNAAKVLEPIKTVVKGIINLINLMIDGINQLSKLPGVEFNISHVPVPDNFAQGGSMPARRVGNGWVTNGARAIVGEGKPNHPEYVIPTDPTYRNRARGLVTQAAERLGMVATPAHKKGGILGGIKDLASKSWDKVKEVGADAINVAMKPVFGLAHAAVDKLPNWTVADHNIPHEAGNGAIDKLQESVKTIQASWSEKYAKAEDKAKKAAAAAAAAGGATKFPVGAGAWTPMSFRGKTVDKGQVESILAAEKALGYAIHIIQGSYSTSVNASAGTHAGGGAVDVSPATVAVQNALRSKGQAAWVRNPSQGPWDYHVHSLMIGDPNLAPKAAAQVADFKNGGDGLANARGGVLNARALKEGGIALASRGPALAQIGDGRYDEAVVPLPKGWRSGGNGLIGSNSGETHYHFYGDLEFPNIKSGDDAETLIENLKNLAKD